MENNATYNALIEAKRLVLSSPEYVYDYLEKKSILEHATSSELQALVTNKSINGSSLADIFKRTGWAENLADEQWFLSCIYALLGKPNLDQDDESITPTGYSEGWEDYEHNKALEAAWQLLENAPLT